MINEFVKTRLEQMLAYPQSWGGPEAYELQVLLLIEIEVLLRELIEEGNPRLVLDRYSAFLQKELPTLGARPCSTVLDDCVKISEYLARFRQSLSG